MVGRAVPVIDPRLISRYDTLCAPRVVSAANSVVSIRPRLVSGHRFV
jgi:hypothetical protein